LGNSPQALSMQLLGSAAPEASRSSNTTSDTPYETPPRLQQALRLVHKKIYMYPPPHAVLCRRPFIFYFFLITVFFLWPRKVQTRRWLCPTRRLRHRKPPPGSCINIYILYINVYIYSAPHAKVFSRRLFLSFYILCLASRSSNTTLPRISETPHRLHKAPRLVYIYLHIVFKYRVNHFL